MEEQSIPPKNSVCEDGVLFILTRKSPPPCDGCGGDHCATPISSRTNSDLTSIDWKREAILLNNPGRKYTIGSGNDLENLDPEKYGQFLIFRNKADGSAKTCLNGKLIPDSPVMLKSGDIFHFSHIFSQLWDSVLIHLVNIGDGKRLYRKNKLGEEYAVFKFDKLTCVTEEKRPLPKKTNIPDKSVTESQDRQKSLINHLVFENHVILTKIFEHLANPDPSAPWNQDDLFTCRLVSQAWNDSARLVLQKNFVLKLKITMDELIRNPNYITNRFSWKTYRMMELKFDAMNIDIWPQKWNYQTRDNDDRIKAMIKFNQDLAAFINPDFHPLKVLTMNIDYLTPISILLSKFCPSLEEIYIQVNMLWINDKKISGFPEDLMFPKLKKLTLEFSEHTRGDLQKMSDSKSLAHLLQAANGIEDLVLQNYAKLPLSEFDSFKNLRKLTIYNQREYQVRILSLHDFLTQFMTLPKGQLRSFKLVTRGTEIQSTPEDALLSFFQNQRQSLQNLELSLNQRDDIKLIKLPRCMPNLRKLWISASDDRTGWNSSWGFKLGSQAAKEVGTFTVAVCSEMLLAPSVVQDGRKCTQKLCRSCNDSLVYGEWLGHEGP
ncbi:hypothetical protein Fcan01_00702 [Folsomia candida]|uniref:FHA domain-containing protein n=1 Tax=Folsomia candida TaxID=158441 RepID=A0A226F570_FOLCA|nr:hypothetical protein Fcan01_00702 [Folsomia candida]